MSVPLRHNQPNVKDSEELNRAIIAEFDRSIANLRRRNLHVKADKLERYKKVFFVKDSNFEEFDEDGTIKYR